MRPVPSPSARLAGRPPCRPVRLRPGWTALSATIVLCAAALPALAQERRVTVSAVARVHEAAFQHWWPKYERLMETLRQNQDVDSGRLKVPPPSPADLRREIHVGDAIQNRYVPGYTFYGVHTQGSVFEGLFLMDPVGRVAVLVNHDDPEDRRPMIEDAYVDHMNRILDEADVVVDDPNEAASLARFFLSTFFNFTVHPEDAPIDSTVQDELQRVRVLSGYREIPQGKRVLRFGSKQTTLVFEVVPRAMREAIQPPVVTRRDGKGFTIRVFTWHPVRGEVKLWDIRIEDDQFVYFHDQTVGRWKPYRFERGR